jgi:hypothetical protein
MKKIIILIFILGFTTIVKAQLPNFDSNFIIDTWARGRCVIEMPGTGYFTFGVDNLRDPVTFAEDRRALAAKLDYNGDTVVTWQLANHDTLFFTTYGYFPEVQFQYACITSDSNLLAVGAKQVYTPQTQYKRDLLLVKFDLNLDTIWTKIIESPIDSSYSVNSIIVTQDNCYLIGGIQVTNTGVFTGMVMKVDSDGNELWHNWFFNPTQNGIYGIAQASNGDILCSGSHYQFGLGDPIIYKVDSNGNNQQMLQQFTSGGGDYGGQIINTDDGKFVAIIGRKLVDSPVWPAYSRLIKLDLNGLIIFDKQFAPTYDGGMVSVIQTNDFGFFTVGYIKHAPTNSLLNGIIMKTTPMGDSLWSREFISIGHPTFFLNGKQTSDGGYVMSGETYCCNTVNGINYTGSLWVVKTDSLGFIVTGMEDLPGFNSYKMGNVYPNPATTLLNVPVTVPQVSATATTTGKQGVYLYIFDMQGRQMAIQQLLTGTTTATINVGDFATGSYVAVLVVDGYKIGSQKFVKE